MKANQFGTASEQVMFRMGYLTAKQRPIQPQCSTCKYNYSYFLYEGGPYESERFRCERGDFSVAKTSICNDWEAK